MDGCVGKIENRVHLSSSEAKTGSLFGNFMTNYVPSYMLNYVKLTVEFDSLATGSNTIDNE